MKSARGAIIVSLGFFALVAQTLLFRDYLASLEGNEIAVGAFFGTWLAWIAAGAMAGRAALKRFTKISSHFEFLILAYIPAFVAQKYLLTHGRSLIGVEAYEVVPLAGLLALSLVTNSLVSFTTGFSFTAACKWNAGQSALPTARVYILEALGAGLGGVAATLALVKGLDAETIFLLSCVVLITPVLSYRAVSTKWPIAKKAVVFALVAIAAAIAFPLGEYLAKASARAAWARLLPAESFEGYFATAQGKYLYGENHGQFTLMSYGSVSETLPNTEAAGQCAAVHMAQNPEAKNVMLIGPGGLSIALQLRKLPQIEKIVWLHNDPALPKKLKEVLPEKWKSKLASIEIPDVDVSEYLKNHDDKFDIIILNVPENSTPALNRYSTLEFYNTLVPHVVQSGIISMNFPGGENYLGDELTLLGASKIDNMLIFYRHFVIQPGEFSRIYASYLYNRLSKDPQELSKRFAAIPGAYKVYPPKAIESLFPKDRVDFQMNEYDRIRRGWGNAILDNMGWSHLFTFDIWELLSRTGISSLSRLGQMIHLIESRQPKAVLLTLLPALRRAGMPSVVKKLPIFMTFGLWMVLGLILCYGVMRLVYLLKSPRDKNRITLPRRYDAQFIVAAMGAVSMSLSIILMFNFQIQYGSLYLYIGLISALFMIGSSVGGWLFEILAARQNTLLPRMLAYATILHFIVILNVLIMEQNASPFLYAGLFGICGIFGGAYFPIAAKRLQLCGMSAEDAGARLETQDHLGGAFGAIITGTVLIPVIGTKSALIILIFCVFVFNIGPLIVRKGAVRAPAHADRFDQFVRPLGYWLFGAVVFIIFTTWVINTAEKGNENRLFNDSAEGMAGGTQFGTYFGSIKYFFVLDDWNNLTAYLWPSWKFIDAPAGYGGPVKLAVYADKDGKLKSFRLIQSHETPAYMNYLEPWMRGLAGKNLFSTDALHDVDAVSGATLTSKAIIRALSESGREFAIFVLKKDIERHSRIGNSQIFDWHVVFLSALLAAAVVLRFFPKKYLRRAFLAVVLIMAGFALNLQYSSDHVMSLLGIRPPPIALNASFFLFAAVPISLILFGNIYCGWLCPFGAAQELIGELRPKTLGVDPDKKTWRYALFGKYILLLLLVVLFCVTGDKAVLGADPLISFFGKARSAWITAFALAIFAMSFFYRRFWCRNLCPVGAFCSLVGGVNLLRRFMPKQKPAACDQGVRGMRDLDCIRCDRCRHE